MSNPTTFADVMADEGNGRRTATHRVCFSTELEDKYYELLGDLEDALKAEQKPAKPGRSGNPARRLGEARTSAVISEEIAKLIADNPTKFYELKFEALEVEDWRALRRQHAPRDDNADDAGLYNSDTFPRAAIKACMVDPEPSEETFAYFKKNLSAGEWEQMTNRVWGLNEGHRIAPKLRADSPSPAGSSAG